MDESGDTSAGWIAAVITATNAVSTIVTGYLTHYFTTRSEHRKARAEAAALAARAKTDTRVTEERIERESHKFIDQRYQKLIDYVNKENTTLRAELRETNARIQEIQEEHVNCRVEVERLHSENGRQKTEAEQLRHRVSELEQRFANPNGAGHVTDPRTNR